MRKLQLIVFMLLVTGYGCASQSTKLPPPEPLYTYGGAGEEVRPSPGSIWTDSASLFEDHKARRVNDLITIKIVEKVSGGNKTETKSDKKDKIDSSISNLLGLIKPTGTAGGSWQAPQGFTPTYNSSSDVKYDAKGETIQEGNVYGTLTAKVIKVLPNGNLVIDARKELNINDDTQTLVIQGMVRPIDIQNDNSVSSQKVADANIFLIGDGFMTENQSRGWFNKFFTKINPF